MAPLRLAFLTASVMQAPKSVAETSAVADNILIMSAAVVKSMKSSSDENDDGDGNIEASAAVNAFSSTTVIRSSISKAAHSISFHSEPTIKEERRGPIHFCFIVHGHQGKPTDLSYLHHTIKDKANQYGGFAATKSSQSCSVGSNDNSQDDVATAKRRKKRDRWPLVGKETNDSKCAKENKQQPQASKNIAQGILANSQSTLIVHNAACNKGTTHDGVVKGGERLAHEMLDVIRSELNEITSYKDDCCSDVTISIVGNSLGGLYGRYAVAQLDELLQISDEDNIYDVPRHYLLDNNIRIHFNVFCSTASPHLGCADRTYVPIPRFAEIGIAKGLGETGRDLFRVNDLMRTMATSQKFTRPLSLFRKRVAYANIYGTDFVVPGSTAAFLDANSDSMHYFDDDEAHSKWQKADKVCPASEKGLFVATCYTPRISLSDPLESAASELEVMSKSLDSLGWTKVFVDIRREIPISAKLPSIIKTSHNDCPVNKLRSTNDHRAVPSKDLCRAISTTVSGNHVILPLGHNAICAFERGRFSTALNKGGRPVMDSLAIKLVQDISMWK